MAVQLPNFLGVPIQKPDYSGLSNIFENYYAGKDMPREAEIRKYKAQEAPLDYLLKQIQSEFARPNAETALSGAKLSNRSTQLSNRQSEMTIQKLQQEFRNQLEIEAAIKEGMGQGGAAAGGGMGSGMGGGQGGGMPQESPEMSPRMASPSMQPQAPGMLSNVPQAPTGAEAVRQQNSGTAFQKGLMEVMQHQAMKNQPMPTQMPIMQDHPAEAAERQSMPARSQSTTQEINAGSPALYGLDQAWDKKPHLRPLIAKQYQKKEIKDEYDKKTGQTRVKTTWPSGRVTVRILEPEFNEKDLEKGIPLTSQVLNKVVNQVRGSDAVQPYMDTLIEMGENRELPHFYISKSDAAANYHSVVDEALEGYMSSTGASNTDLSTKKMESILGRHFNESTANYIARLKRKKTEMAKAREMNVKMITKGLKKNPNIINQSGSEKSYSSDEWEQAHE